MLFRPVLSTNKVIFLLICFYQGTDINDKVRGTLNTPAVMKMLNTSESGDLATPRLEDSSIASLETPLSNQDKMMLETPLRLSLTLECDMYESDVMLDTLSDTSTWSCADKRWNSTCCRMYMYPRPRITLQQMFWYLATTKGFMLIPSVVH